MYIHVHVYIVVHVLITIHLSVNQPEHYTDILYSTWRKQYRHSETSYSGQYMYMCKYMKPSQFNVYNYINCKEAKPSHTRFRIGGYGVKNICNHVYNHSSTGILC